MDGHWYPLLLMYLSPKANLLPDYMDQRKVFTLDPNYFPLPRMREIVDYLHSHNQQYGKRSWFNSESTPLTAQVN